MSSLINRLFYFDARFDSERDKPKKQAPKNKNLAIDEQDLEVNEKIEVLDEDNENNDDEDNAAMAALR